MTAILSTVKVEPLSSGSASVELTTSKLEAYSGGSATVNLSTTKKEIYTGGSATVKVSTVKIEIFRSNLDPVSPDQGCEPDARTGPVRVPVYCIPPPRSRFRRFWSTQFGACVSEQSEPDCAQPKGASCANSGLVLVPQFDPCYQELNWKGGSFSQCGPGLVGATISTDNWVAGMIINILGTNAQQAKSICGNRPGQIGGYWLDDISGAKVGTSIRYIPTKGFDIDQTVEYIRQTALSDMHKLITYGVAKSVAAAAKYSGGNSISLIVTAVGVDDVTTRVNSSMTKIKNAWVWN